jgi:hypothetical protein
MQYVNEVVIDTNVLLIANGKHPDASPECVAACIAHLQEIQAQGKVVIDDGFHLLHEYLHKTSLHPAKGVGDEFLEWLLNNIDNQALVETVSIHETAPDIFAEFPVPELQTEFDPADRKFVAVAAAHPAKPPIWQGADCKWLHWWPQLQAAGTRVVFLCPDDACRWFKHKFPHEAAPVFPTRLKPEPPHD